MSCVVGVEEFKARQARAQQRADLVHAVAKDLDAMCGALIEHTFQLAMLGPWREWNDAQPEGAMVELDVDALAQVDDQDVRALVDLAYTLDQVATQLRHRTGVAGG